MPLVHRTLTLGPMDNNTYLIACSESREAAVVDVGFEPGAVVAAVRRAGWRVTLLLNTHAHYDHIAGMREVQCEVGGTYWLHPADRAMLDAFNADGAMFGLPAAALPDDPHDLADGQRLKVGGVELRVLHTPGHSPGHVTFVAGEDAWSGDVLFAGSVGRTDLAGGSWPELERSIRERRGNPFVGDGALPA